MDLFSYLFVLTLSSLCASVNIQDVEYTKDAKPMISKNSNSANLKNYVKSDSIENNSLENIGNNFTPKTNTLSITGLNSKSRFAPNNPNKFGINVKPINNIKNTLNSKLKKNIKNEDNARTPVNFITDTDTSKNIDSTSQQVPNSFKKLRSNIQSSNVNGLDISAPSNPVLTKSNNNINKITNQALEKSISKNKAHNSPQISSNLNFNKSPLLQDDEKDKDDEQIYYQNLQSYLNNVKSGQIDTNSSSNSKEKHVIPEIGQGSLVNESKPPEDNNINDHSQISTTNMDEEPESMISNRFNLFGADDIVSNGNDDAYNEFINRYVVPTSSREEIEPIQTKPLFLASTVTYNSINPSSTDYISDLETMPTVVFDGLTQSPKSTTINSISSEDGPTQASTEYISNLETMPTVVFDDLKLSPKPTAINNLGPGNAATREPNSSKLSPSSILKLTKPSSTTNTQVISNTNLPLENDNDDNDNLFDENTYHSFLTKYLGNLDSKDNLDHDLSLINNKPLNPEVQKQTSLSSDISPINNSKNLMEFNVDNIPTNPNDRTIQTLKTNRNINHAEELQTPRLLSSTNDNLLNDLDNYFNNNNYDNNVQDYDYNSDVPFIQEYIYSRQPSFYNGEARFSNTNSDEQDNNNMIVLD